MAAAGTLPESQMKIKSYYSRTVEDAIAAARHAVGAVLGWIFIGHGFAPYLPAEQLDSYIAGLILLAAAPCTAMVFVWSRLTNGDPMFTLSQVALNDSIMVFAYAPIVALLLGLSALTVPW